MIPARRVALSTVLVLAGCWRAEPAPPRSTTTTGAAVRVTSMAELLAALRPGVTIALAPGDYHLDDLPRTPGPHHRWAAMFEGQELAGADPDMLVLTRLRDVTLRAERPDARPRLVTSIASATVLVLEDATNVTLRDLSIGHAVAGECGGGVVSVIGGGDVHVDGCALSGSGTFGVEAYRTHDLRISRTRIFHTSESALVLHDTHGAAITDTTIEDNRSNGSFVTIDGSPGVTLERVTVRNNRYLDTAVDDQAVFSISDSARVSLRDAEVSGNTTEYFRAGDLTTTNVTQRDNTWVSGEVRP